MNTKKGARKQINNTAKLIDRWLDYQVYLQEIPGMAIGIVHDGEIVHASTFGYAEYLEENIFKKINAKHMSVEVSSKNKKLVAVGYGHRKS